ncbi:MAG: DUF4112 domain-containing protein [Haloarculaceae archaeon]
MTDSRAVFEPRCDVAVPADLPADVDAAALGRMDAVAYVLDEGIPVPGTGYRVGLDPLAGVLPVAGDAATAVASLLVVAQAAALGVGRWTLARMLVNVAVDAAAGSVPVVGDLFDAAWKANSRNLELAFADLAAPATGRGRGPDRSTPTPADAGGD